MNHELVLEIVKDLVGIVILGVGKMFWDVRSNRADIDIAFTKIRNLEKQLDDKNTPSK